MDDGAAADPSAPGGVDLGAGPATAEAEDKADASADADALDPAAAAAAAAAVPPEAASAGASSPSETRLGAAAATGPPVSPAPSRHWPVGSVCGPTGARPPANSTAENAGRSSGPETCPVASSGLDGPVEQQQQQQQNVSAASAANSGLDGAGGGDACHALGAGGGGEDHSEPGGAEGGGGTSPSSSVDGPPFGAAAGALGVVRSTPGQMAGAAAAPVTAPAVGPVAPAGAAAATASATTQEAKGAWECSKCHASNAGNVREGKCRRCKYVKVTYHKDLPDNEPFGGSIECGKCGYHNGPRGSCMRCKGNTWRGDMAKALAEHRARLAARPVADNEPFHGSWGCSKCGYHNTPSRRNCKRCFKGKKPAKTPKPKKKGGDILKRKEAPDDDDDDEGNAGEDGAMGEVPWECPKCDGVTLLKPEERKRCKGCHYRPPIYHEDLPNNDPFVGSWECRKCRYHNDDERCVCRRCKGLRKRPRDGEWAEEGSWQCRACRHRNDALRFACTKCRTARPVDADAGADATPDGGASVGNRRGRRGGRAAAPATASAATQEAKSAWECSKCHASNAGTVRECRRCRYVKVTYHKDLPDNKPFEDSIECKKCGYHNGPRGCCERCRGNTWRGDMAKALAEHRAEEARRLVPKVCAPDEKSASAPASSSRSSADAELVKVWRCKACDGYNPWERVKCLTCQKNVGGECFFMDPATRHLVEGPPKEMDSNTQAAPDADAADAARINVEEAKNASTGKASSSRGGAASAPLQLSGATVTWESRPTDSKKRCGNCGFTKVTYHKDLADNLPFEGSWSCIKCSYHNGSNRKVCERCKGARPKGVCPPPDASGESSNTRLVRDATTSRQSVSDVAQAHATPIDERPSQPVRPLSAASQVLVTAAKPPEDQEAVLNKPFDASAFSLPPPTNGGYYVEEEAWRTNNYPVDGLEASTVDDAEQLRRLPVAPPLPPLPCTGHCRWSFDEASRVLHADFVPQKADEQVIVTSTDESFLLRMMERDDITIISEGLASNLNASLWNSHYLKEAVGKEFHHKVRQFSRQTVTKDKLVISPVAANSMAAVSVAESSSRCCVTHREKDGDLAMNLSDYVQYLDKRKAALARITSARKAEGHSSPFDFGAVREDKVGRCAEAETMNFEDSDGKMRSLNVVDTVLYLIDYDMVKLLPVLHEDFISSFKLQGCLPGGRHCMMNSVNGGGRPFMGPNLYVTPPASFTHFHQDGHGTVDSGHQCLTGYNEVVMLRRMPERHKKHALSLLNGEDRRQSMTPSSLFDGLYGLPHGDGLGEKPMWPDTEAIRRCKEMNYYPSVFILKPGQLVHINKGRLHAFRKMSLASLPDEDCHSQLRSKLITKEGLVEEQICMSVAWDWMFKGVTSGGINREVSAIIECCALNRKNYKQSLAIPESSLLLLARHCLAELKSEEGPPSAFSGFGKYGIVLKKATGPSSSEVLKGILPSLEHVIDKHVSTFENALSLTQQTFLKDKVSIAIKPNAWENPDIFELNPYGEDFFCIICSSELSNSYFHCDGCEKILNKDFNICLSCHKEGKYRTFHQMHPLNPVRNSTINHTGDMKKDQNTRCSCKQKMCKSCSYCAGCSCRCHRWFTLHQRFMNVEEEVVLLENAKLAVGQDTLPATSDTLARLAYANHVTGVAAQPSDEVGDRESTARTTREVEDKGASGVREPAPDLGEGWMTETTIRTEGTRAGQKDIYYYSPDGDRFRSRAEAERFLQEHSQSRSSAEVDGEYAGREPAPDLGEGWMAETTIRTQGTRAGQKDVYYYSPDGDRFRSRTKAEQFVQSQSKSRTAVAGCRDQLARAEHHVADAINLILDSDLESGNDSPASTRS